ncbi:MAG: hypothetical protein AMXMBFR4_31060 [Candidatus Hydrogenedentota bacterium]
MDISVLRIGLRFQLARVGPAVSLTREKKASGPNLRQNDGKGRHDNADNKPCRERGLQQTFAGYRR